VQAREWGVAPWDLVAPESKGLAPWLIWMGWASELIAHRRKFMQATGKR
jgi:hypothetical protein